MERNGEEISLHASDSWDEEDDIQMLTEHQKVNDQKEREKQAETMILEYLANTFDGDDNTSGKIQQQLAGISTKRWGKKLAPEKN
jgi:hypothetical protein